MPQHFTAASGSNNRGTRQGGMMKLTFADSLKFAAEYALRTGRTDPADLLKALRRYENKWDTDPLTLAPIGHPPAAFGFFLK